MSKPTPIKPEVKKIFEENGIIVEENTFEYEIKYKNGRPNFAYIGDYDFKFCINTVSSNYGLKWSMQYLNELQQAVNILNKIYKVQPEIVLIN